MATALEHSLRRFYEDRAHADVLASVADGTAPVSIALVRWYAENVVQRDYASRVKAYTRGLFDPAKRTRLVVLSYSDRAIETSVGQMNFFRWLIGDGHWADLVRDADAVSRRMATTASKTGRKPARAAAKKLVPYDAPAESKNLVLNF